MCTVNDQEMLVTVGEGLCDKDNNSNRDNGNDDGNKMNL